MFSESVYAVLYESGRVKVGYSSNLFQRLRQHIQNCRSFGDRLDMIFFTEPHDGAEATEKDLIDFFSKNAQKITSEYFEGADRKMVRLAMLKTNKMVSWSSSLSTRGDCLLVPAASIGFTSCEQSDDEPSKKIKGRILASIKRTPGVTLGVIKNRFRGLDKDHIEIILKELESESEIVIDQIHHPKRVNETFLKYYPAGSFTPPPASV